MKYFKFKETFVFNNDGYFCICGLDEKIYEIKLERGDGIQTSYKIDLMTEEINQIRAFF